MVTYNLDIPNPPDNPSLDVPLMKTNTNSINTILAVDHIPFNTANGGTHKQVTFISENAAGPQTDPTSVLFTGPGTASTNADLFFRNQDGTFRPNMVKAAGVFTTVAVTGAVAIDMGVNISSITYSSVTQSITINLTAGAVNGTTAMVFVDASSGTTPGWVLTANTLTLLIITPASSGRKIAFEILQV